MMTQALPTRTSRVLGLAPLLALVLGAFGCATAPDTREESTDMIVDANAQLDEMLQQDPSLRDVLDNSYAYVMFPYVGQGGLVVAGGSGSGVVYRNDGEAIGFAELRTASIGAQAGGQMYSELIVFRDQAAFEDFRDGDFSLEATVSATVVESGAAEQADFDAGTAVFVYDESGAMLQAAVGGQTIDFVEGPMT
jgi:lipid-binding SYLF domain-containing protein